MNLEQVIPVIANLQETVLALRKRVEELSRIKVPKPPPPPPPPPPLEDQLAQLQVLNLRFGDVHVLADKNGITLQTKRATLKLDKRGTVSVDAKKVEVSTTAALTLACDKKVDVTGNEIALAGNKIVGNAQSQATLKSAAQLDVEGGSTVTIKGGLVKIN